MGRVPPGGYVPATATGTVTLHTDVANSTKKKQHSQPDTPCAPKKSTPAAACKSLLKHSGNMRIGVIAGRLYLPVSPKIHDTSTTQNERYPAPQAINTGVNSPNSQLHIIIDSGYIYRVLRLGSLRLLGKEASTL